MAQLVRYGFSILLPVSNLFWDFKEALKLSHITAVAQEHLQPRLVINLTANTDVFTPNVNDTIYR